MQKQKITERGWQGDWDNPDVLAGFRLFLTNSRQDYRLAFT